MFTQAMISTKSTAPKSTKRPARMSPTTNVCRETSLIPAFVFESGCSRSSCCARTVAALCACGNDRSVLESRDDAQDDGAT